MLPTTADLQEIVYPEKFPLQVGKDNSSIIKSVMGILLYIIVGYLLFSNLLIIVLITAILVLHEMGHFVAMRIFKYADTAVFFIPMLGAYVTGKKREVSQRESVIILLAGSMPGIILGAIIYLIWQQIPGFTILGISAYTVSLMLMFLNIVNLLPIYPLDGGQILNRVFIDEESVYSKGFKLLSALLMIFIAVKLKFYFIIIIVAYILVKHLFSKTINKYEKLAEQNGFDLNKDYEGLSDKEYWQIRDLMIPANPDLKQFKAGEPYQYDKQEEKMASFIQNLLSHYLIEDLSVAHKILILVIWLGLLFLPWILQMDLGVLTHFLSF